MNENTKFWQAKLAAWVHDPAEKALVLLRDKAGHEGGTVSALCGKLFGTDKVPSSLRDVVKQSDRWSAAADRPQIPWKEGERYPEWSKVSFSSRPVLVHPVSPSVQVDLKHLGDEISIGEIKAVSFDHFDSLIVRNDDGSVDFRKTFLRFWRFGPELSGTTNLGALWELLPADTRSPDHSIWDHLKLASALAGPFACNDAPALLVVSLGPVQGFISQARTTSDLWAGSHLLSRMAWEAMKVVCERFGPDAVLFPDLHRIPWVDTWLSEEEQISWPDDVKKSWLEKDGKSLRAFDVNPLFSASLPNKFVAVVPERQATDIAETMTDVVRKWARQNAEQAACELFKKAGMSQEMSGIVLDQITKQFEGFPEVHWSVAPWSLIDGGDGKLADRITRLKTALAEFHPEEDRNNPGFFKTDAWKVLQKTYEAGGIRFEPNLGACYPGLYDLSDRLHAATKTARAFWQSAQEGYRCSLCGEREWLTHVRELLNRPPDKRDGAVWKKLHERENNLAGKSEFLCAQCSLKRVWPRLYADEMKMLGSGGGSRYIVSTHTMALASSIDDLLTNIDTMKPEEKLRHVEAAQKLQAMNHSGERAAFPRRLHRQLNESELGDVLRRLPALLDMFSDDGSEDEKNRIDGLVKDLFGKKAETYYGLILMDGDGMGEWLSGQNPELQPKYRDILHPDVSGKLLGEGSLDEFMNTRRPATPGRHQAISRALNHFSQDLARHMVEEVFKGKLIYSGGDDLLAMVSVDDLPGLMLGLRCLYAGHKPDGDWNAVMKDMDMRGMKLMNGHALLRKKLYRLMGPRATCSMGAVITHHKAPLGRVMRDLRASEKTAKAVPGKDAFSIRLDKRAGGTTHFTSGWMLEGMSKHGLPVEASPMGAMLGLRNLLAGEKMSRKAAYVLHDLFRNLPAEKDALEKAMVFQLKRQGGHKDEVEKLAARLAELAMKKAGDKALAVEKAGDKARSESGAVPAPNEWLQELFIAAEFLAREGRTRGDA